jgi:NADH-quinone oxidoreductase subunit C
MSADMDNSKIIELVLGALDGDMDTINAIEDRVVRSKAKAALFKAKKDPEGYRAKNIVSSNDSEPSSKAVSNEVKDASLINLVLKGLDGDMDSVNAIEDRVFRSKVKSALVKAKKNPEEFKKLNHLSTKSVDTETVEKTQSESKKDSISFKIKEMADSKFPGSITNENIEDFLLVKPNLWYDLADMLKNESSFLFDSLQCQTGFDIGEDTLEARYNLHSMTKNHYIEIRIQVPVKNPQIPSVETVWRIADWFERETYDMFGIEFLKHRDLRRILLPEDWEGWPLRKNYEVQETYHGIVIPKMKEGWE